MMTTNQGWNPENSPRNFPPTGRAAASWEANTGMAPHDPNFPSRHPVDKSRKKWTIAIIAAVVVLLGLLITFGVMWFLGGDSQGARSACTKASTDLTKKYEILQESVKTAEDIIQNTDPSDLGDPQILQDLRLKAQQASQAVTPLPCDATLKQQQLAKNTSEMMATTDKLSAQIDDLENAINAVRGTQNIKGLDSVKADLENTVKTGDELMKQSENEKLDDKETLAALKAQLDDAKRLLEQVNGLQQVSDDKVSELSESIRAAKNRLNEDMDAVKKAVEKKRQDQARQEAEAKLKQLEQQRLEQERQASERARQQPSHSPHQGTGEADGDDQTRGRKSPACSVGSTMTDPNGGQWKCVNILDPATGSSVPSWVQEAPAATPTDS